MVSSSSRPPPPPPGRDDEEQRLGWRMAGVGFEVASEVAAGAILGWLFDWWRGTAPTGLLVGSIIGIAVGLWSLIRSSLKINRELERRFPTKGRGKPIIDNADLNSDHDGEDDDDWNEPDGRDDDKWR